MLSDIRVSCSPHISERFSTRSVMVDVVIGLAPAMAAAVYYFRMHAPILIAACVISCVATEWLCNLIRKKPSSLDDFSAVVTGVILALSLPPSLPVWAAVIGSVVSITIGKMVFGGLGGNIFNPAMVGRTFLTVSFGVMMTSWTVPASIDSAMPPVAQENLLDARTQATPLAWSKLAIKNELGADVYSEKRFTPALMELVGVRLGETSGIARLIRGLYLLIRSAIRLGEVGGCLGETSAIALLIGGLYLLIRRTINFHIPLAVLSAAFVFAGIAYLIDSYVYVQPLFHLTSGGLLLCAFFIATDPVTAPLTRRGMWVFGIGVGTLTMLIRIVGEYPEGIMFSILLMNAVTPLIDRFFKRIPAGGKPSV